MSQSEQILLFASAVGAKCKELNSHIGALSGLSTQAKTSLVDALNEVNAALAALNGTVGTNGSDIAQLKLDVDAVEAAVEALEGEFRAQSCVDDSAVSTTKAYSSDKVVKLIGDAKLAVKNDILGGAGEAYDTLQELKDFIDQNKGFIDSLTEMAGNRVRWDEAQTIPEANQAIARANISAVAVADHEALAGRVTTAEGKVTTLEGKMTAVEGKAAANEGAIAGLDTRVGAVETLAGANQTAVNGLTERMTAVEGKASGNETALGALTTRVGAVETKAGENTAAIAALAEAVGDTAADYKGAFEAALA